MWKNFPLMSFWLIHYPVPSIVAHFHFEIHFHFGRWHGVNWAVLNVSIPGSHSHTERIRIVLPRTQGDINILLQISGQLQPLDKPVTLTMQFPVRHISQIPAAMLMLPNMRRRRRRRRQGACVWKGTLLLTDCS